MLCVYLQLLLFLQYLMVNRTRREFKSSFLLNHKLCSPIGSCLESTFKTNTWVHIYSVFPGYLTLQFVQFVELFLAGQLTKKKKAYIGCLVSVALR